MCEKLSDASIILGDNYPDTEGVAVSELDSNFHSAYTKKMKYRIFRKLFVYFIQIKVRSFKFLRYR